MTVLIRAVELHSHVLEGRSGLEFSQSKSEGCDNGLLNAHSSVFSMSCWKCQPLAICFNSALEKLVHPPVEHRVLPTGYWDTVLY